MLQKFILLFIAFTFLISSANAQWVQLGADMLGEAGTDAEFGNAVDFNHAGDIMIGGANSNYAKVYKEENGVWTQLGNTLTGPVGEGYGWGVSINAAGDIIAVGEFGGAGKVHIYELIGNVWTAVGSPIEGGIHNGYYDNFGYAVALNDAGDRVVASSIYGNLGNGVESGFVNVYDLVNGEWQQVGASIEGTAGGQHFGEKVEMNADGSRLVVGVNSGTTGAYVYEENNGNWQLLGQPILSSNVAGIGTIYAPTIDKTGNTVAFLYYGNTSRTWVYSLVGNTWTPKGTEINLGGACSLNGDGSILAISNSNGNGNAWVYQFDNTDWTQIDAVIAGESGDYLGVSNCLNHAGDRLLVGAPGIGPSLTGATQVYENNSIPVITGMADAPTANVSIYPVPATNALNILTTETIENMAVYAMDGKQVSSHAQNTKSIDVSALAKGMYLLVVQTEKGMTQRRFVVE